MKSYSRSLENKEQLVEYLTLMYEVSEDYAAELCQKHKELIEKRIGLGSYIYYVGDEIADLEDLKVIEDYEESDEQD